MPSKAKYIVTDIVYRKFSGVPEMGNVVEVIPSDIVGGGVRYDYLVQFENKKHGLQREGENFLFESFDECEKGKDEFANGGKVKPNIGQMLYEIDSLPFVKSLTKVKKTDKSAPKSMTMRGVEAYRLVEDSGDGKESIEYLTNAGIEEYYNVHVASQKMENGGVAAIKKKIGSKKESPDKIADRLMFIDDGKLSILMREAKEYFSDETWDAMSAADRMDAISYLIAKGFIDDSEFYADMNEGDGAYEPSMQYGNGGTVSDIVKLDTAELKDDVPIENYGGVLDYMVAAIQRSIRLSKNLKNELTKTFGKYNTTFRGEFFNYIWIVEYHGNVYQIYASLRGTTFCIVAPYPELDDGEIAGVCISFLKKFEEMVFGKKFGNGGIARSTDVAVRKSPSVSATIYPKGFTMVGNDGNMWQIVLDSRAVHRWQKCKGAPDSGINSYEEFKAQLIKIAGECQYNDEFANRVRNELRAYIPKYVSILRSDIKAPNNDYSLEALFKVFKEDVNLVENAKKSIATYKMLLAEDDDPELKSEIQSKAILKRIRFDMLADDGDDEAKEAADLMRNFIVQSFKHGGMVSKLNEKEAVYNSALRNSHTHSAKSLLNKRLEDVNNHKQSMHN